MEVEHRLALHADLVSDDVVRRPELGDPYECAHPPEDIGNSRMRLAHVSIYGHSVHRLQTMEEKASPSCAVFVEEVRTAEIWADFPAGEGRS